MASFYNFIMAGRAQARNDVKNWTPARERLSRAAAGNAALAVGSSSANHGTFVLVSTAGAHNESRALRAAIERQQLLSLTTIQPVSGSTSIPIVRHFRNTYFGHITKFGDNLQGRCDWACFPTIAVDEFDEAYLQFWDPTAAFLFPPGQAAIIEQVDRDLYMRSNMSQKVTLDVWLLWPKMDILRNSTTDWDYTSIVANDYSAPALLTEPMSDGTINVTPGNNNSDSAEWKTNSKYRYDEWAASPLDNFILREFFNIQHKHTVSLNPGEEVSFKWGLPHHLEVNPTASLIIDPVDMKAQSKYPHFDQFAYMKKCGPLVLIRARGHMCHDEAQQTIVGPGAHNNFGLFNVEYALVSNFQFRPMNTYLAQIDFSRGTIPANTSPPEVYQMTLSNCVNYADRAVAETAAGI